MRCSPSLTRLFVVLLVLLVPLMPFSAAHAANPQDATITFSPPTTGGAPTGYRAYRDATLVGPVVSGQPLTAFFPADIGTFVVGVEPFNATGAGPRTTATAVLGPTAPGAIPKITITVPCATALPPTCTLVVN